jgi:hypothetical protein
MARLRNDMPWKIWIRSSTRRGSIRRVLAENITS